MAILVLLQYSIRLSELSHLHNQVAKPFVCCDVSVGLELFSIDIMTLRT